jgi:hyperosmotically inducible protein
MTSDGRRAKHGARAFSVAEEPMIDRAIAAALVALGAALAAGCERSDRENLRSDAKKLVTDTRTAAQNTAADAKESLGRAGETASQIAGDAALTARVKAALLAEKDVKSADIDVDAFQGKVILRGTVPDTGQIERATRVARAVEGVKAVDNRLAIH